MSRTQRDLDERVVTAEELRDDTPRGTATDLRPAPARTDYERPINRRRGGGGMGALGIFLAIAAAVLIGLILWALFAADDGDEVANAGVSIDDITDNPSRYFGRTVTVAGEVDEIIGQRALTIGGDDFIGEDELLVVSVNQLPNVSGRPGANRLDKDDLVQVTGPVRRFAVADLEREIGTDLDDNLFRDWEGKPAVVARQVNVMPRGAGARITDLNTLFNEPNKEALVSRQVRLTGLKVQAMPAPNVFWVGPSNDRLLFVTRGAQTPMPSPNITVGDTITIEGLVLRVPPMEQARQLWNLDQQNIGQLQNQQIYVQAHQINKAGE